MPSSPSEISWFSALCDDDYEFLGQPDPRLQSSFEHCRSIILAAEKGGFDNILLPSGFALGIDGTTIASAVGALTSKIRMLLAVRCGEMWPPQLARQLATLDQILAGRLTINIISSDLPGSALESAPRYRRTLEVMEIVRTLMSGDDLSFDGEFFQLELEAPRFCKQSRRAPPYYFGGLSDNARDVAAKGADVFLMWPDTKSNVQEILDDMRKRAAAYDRQLKYGYRVHVIVRETEDEARAYAGRLMSKLDEDVGTATRQKSLDHASVGVQRQAQMRDIADDEGFAEDHLWTGIGRARSGCGAAIVGDPDQVLAKIKTYQEMGFEAFIFSGYPHAQECDLFSRYVLPQLDHGPLEV